MKFDESCSIANSRSALLRTAKRIASRATDLPHLVNQWVSEPGRDVLLCNGLNHEHHFDSLCVVLRYNQKPIIERYLKLPKVTQLFPIAPAINSFTPWHALYEQLARGACPNIRDVFDRESYARALKLGWSARWQPDLQLHVFTLSEAWRIAISHALAPYGDATISYFDQSFFEGEPTLLSRWEKRPLRWLFTTCSSPHPIGGERLHEVASLLFLERGTPPLSVPQHTSSNRRTNSVATKKRASPTIPSASTAWFATEQPTAHSSVASLQLPPRLASTLSVAGFATGGASKTIARGAF